MNFFFSQCEAWHERRGVSLTCEYLLWGVDDCVGVCCLDKMAKVVVAAVSLGRERV